MKIITKTKKEIDLIVAEKIKEIILKEKAPLLLLATGNTPIDIYKNLIEFYNKKELSFKNVTTFNLDEYIGIENFEKDSFRYFMNTHLFDHVDIDKNNTFFPDSEKNYNDKLDKYKNFDFTILGVGQNGHIAFNEPGSKIETRTNVIELTDSTLKANFPGRNEYPTKAITMGLHDIYNKSNLIYLIAYGENKREALEKVLEGKKDLNWPITNLIDHKNIVIFTDLKLSK